MDDRPMRKSEDIVATQEEAPIIGADGKSIRRQQKFGGRRSVWPGALALIVGISAAIGALVYWGTYEHKQMLARQPNAADQAAIYGSGHTITDGSNSSVPVAEDIAITNPISYKDMGCAQINFLSKKNQIYTVSKGVETPFRIKGVNWLGLEGWDHVITGLWDGPRDGNTLYRIAKFLSNNKFNAVRLPVDVFTASVNNPVQPNFNTNSQRALAMVKNYTDQIRLIAEGLGQFNIAVVLDFNTRSGLDDLNATDHSVIALENRKSSDGDDGLTGNGWFSNHVSQVEYNNAVKNLASVLCDSKHWNVMGIDIKDAPAGAAGLWDGEEKTSWQKFASGMAQTITKACPSWVVFAQGLNGNANFPNGDLPRSVPNPFGSNLVGALTTPITAGTAQKIVYAPRFWGPSVYPAPYFYKSSTGLSMLSKFTEFGAQSDMTASVQKAMTTIFGDLLGQQDAAVVLSSFGSLYGSEDAHPGNSSTMAVNAMIAQMTGSGKTLAGGFWWSLNPDNNWAHPAPDSDKSIASGLLDTTWRSGNPNNLAATKLMDAMPGLAPLPCDPR
ncbi:Aste57867_22878 [Aphanomyces stellatus]|uniref:Aste57867_22878 protein n=1 Tax=Aphanomyces stellatus TaxID=120398 RepID=A0A485LMT2_9STRA|nr:hypothetical protein As57867_022807 [Aphanomyces stellatus]VFT99528.1 Aste57867_22878 [Aphanomyces stellatus]